MNIPHFKEQINVRVRNVHEIYLRKDKGGCIDETYANAPCRNRSANGGTGKDSYLAFDRTCASLITAVFNMIASLLKKAGISYFYFT